MAGGYYRSLESALVASPESAPQNVARGGSPEWLGRAAHLVNRIVNEVGTSTVFALGLVGGLAHESGGLQPNINQGGHCGEPSMGKGGYGYAQWTGPRKHGFVSWCHENGLSPQSVEANEGYLIHELKTTFSGALSAMRGVKNLRDAVVVAERTFEQAGTKAYESRLKYAQIISDHLGHGADYAADSPRDYVAPTSYAPTEHPSSTHRRRHHNRLDLHSYAWNQKPTHARHSHQQQFAYHHKKRNSQVSEAVL